MEQNPNMHGMNPQMRGVPNAGAQMTQQQREAALRQHPQMRTQQPPQAANQAMKKMP